MIDIILTSGKLWKFGDNIDTDLMLPGSVLWGSQEQRRRAVFHANRPTWVDEVSPGDAMVMGKNFGMGSSRPAALSLMLNGVTFAIAESINGLFFRNCVNYGFSCFEVRGCQAAFEEGDGIELSTGTWTARNPRTGVELVVQPVPDMPLRLMTEGGIFPVLESRGLIRSPQREAMAEA